MIIGELIIPFENIEILSFLPWDLKTTITEPLIVGGLDSLLQILDYPELAKRSGMQGCVLYEFTITQNGKSKDIKLIKGIGQYCDEMVLDAIKHLNYISAKKDGININQIMRLSVKFSLYYKKP